MYVRKRGKILGRKNKMKNFTEADGSEGKI